MGAGDVKLMAGIGAIMGWIFALNTAFFAALAGGAGAIGILACQGALIRSFKNIGFFIKSLIFHHAHQTIQPLSRKQSLPYAVMIAVGAVIAYFFPCF
jgi:prepilin peptidase CpaA